LTTYTPITYPAWSSTEGRVYSITFDASATYSSASLPAPCAITLTFTLTWPHLEGGVYWYLDNNVWNNTAWTPAPCTLYLDGTAIITAIYDTNTYAYTSFDVYTYYGTTVQHTDWITMNTNLVGFGVDPITTGVHTLEYSCGGSTTALFGSSFPDLGLGVANILQWGMPTTIQYSFSIPAGDIRAISAGIAPLFPGTYSTFYVSFSTDPALGTQTLSQGITLVNQWGSSNPHTVVITKDALYNWGLYGMTALQQIEFYLNFTPIVNYKLSTLTIST